MTACYTEQPLLTPRNRGAIDPEFTPPGFNCYAGRMCRPDYLPLNFFRTFLCCLLLLASVVSTASEHFSKPVELEPDVAFWIRVYTEIDTSSGFIHDAYNVAVVYETLTLRGARRADEKSIRAAKKRYASILKTLALGRGNLNAQEERILSLWGPDVTAAQLHDAAANLRFQRGQSDRFLAGLARSGQWNEHIEKVLADRNLPAELAALPHVESSFNPDAYSSIGAAGIWQFTRSTGRRYLHIDYVIDERMDPFASTVAAAQLLEHNYQLTGTWPLALTAYNHGASGVRRAAKQMGSTDIAPIVRTYRGRSFGFASRNFYVSFLAAVEVSADPGQYFAPFEAAPQVNYEHVALPDYLLADSIARAFNADLGLLKKHNRALLDPVWRGKKRIPKGYILRIPQESLTDSLAQLLTAIPAEERFVEQTPDLFHKVVPGDTVSEIALRYGHSVRDIVAMNSLNKRYKIRIGQVLRLPLEGETTTAEVSPIVLANTQQAPAPKPPGDTAVTIAEEIAEQPRAMPARPDILADPGDYTVAANKSIEIQAVETLGHYAEWLDLRASHLRRLNGMRYGRALVIGRRLKLDFSRISKNEFESRRLAYHYNLQQSFFMAWQIRSTRRHIIAPGESLWVLTQRQFKIPMWLLRQYNPDLDLDKLHPGTVIVIPQVAEA